jgi:hypothetical protein
LDKSVILIGLSDISPLEQAERLVESEVASMAMNC